MCANEEVWGVCEVCGKPCGPPREGAKVYHWECAFEIMRETREQIQKERRTQNPPNEISLS